MGMGKRELLLGCVFVFGLAVPPGEARGVDGCREGPCHRVLEAGEIGHAPFEEGRCRSCHKGSGSRHPAGAGAEFRLEHGGGGTLCYSCHEAVAGAVARSASVHLPVAEGVCLGCHDAHASPYAGLLTSKLTGVSSQGVPVRAEFTREDFSLCWACHDVYMLQMKKTTTRTGFRKGSENLHYVHVGGERGHPCRACHAVHASRGEMLTGRSLEWTEDLVGYNPRPGGGECSPGCHEPRSYSREE